MVKLPVRCYTEGIIQNHRVILFPFYILCGGKQMRQCDGEIQERSDSWKSIWVLIQIKCFPGGATGKEPACQCTRHKRCWFDPWSRKILWRRKQQPTPGLLPGESHGQRSLVGYGECTHTHTHTHTHAQRETHNLMTICGDKNRKAVR